MADTPNSAATQAIKKTIELTAKNIKQLQTKKRSLKKDQQEKLEILNTKYTEFAARMVKRLDKDKNSSTKTFIDLTHSLYEEINTLLSDQRLAAIYSTELAQIRGSIMAIYVAAGFELPLTEKEKLKQPVAAAEVAARIEPEAIDIGPDLQEISKILGPLEAKIKSETEILGEADINDLNKIIAQISDLSTRNPDDFALQQMLQTRLPSAIAMAAAKLAKPITDKAPFKLTTEVDSDKVEPKDLKALLELLERLTQLEKLSAVENFKSIKNIDVSKAIEWANGKISRQIVSVKASWAGFNNAVGKKLDDMASHRANLPDLTVGELHKRQEELIILQKKLNEFQSLLGDQPTGFQKEMNEDIVRLLKERDKAFARITETIEQKLVSTLLKSYASTPGSPKTPIKELFLKKANRAQAEARREQIDFFQGFIDKLNIVSSLSYLKDEEGYSLAATHTRKIRILRGAIAYFKKNMQSSATSVGVKDFQAMLKDLEESLPKVKIEGTEEDLIKEFEAFKAEFHDFGLPEALSFNKEPEAPAKKKSSPISDADKEKVSATMEKPLPSTEQSRAADKSASSLEPSSAVKRSDSLKKDINNFLLRHLVSQIVETKSIHNLYSQDRPKYKAKLVPKQLKERRHELEFLQKLIDKLYTEKDMPATDKAAILQAATTYLQRHPKITRLSYGVGRFREMLTELREQLPTPYNKAPTDPGVVKTNDSIVRDFFQKNKDHFKGNPYLEKIGKVAPEPLLSQFRSLLNKPKQTSQQEATQTLKPRSKT